MRERLDLRPEEKLIMLAADIQPNAAVLEEMDALIPQITDWAGFSKMAVDRAASPLILDKLPRLNRSAMIPQEVMYQLKQASLRTLSRNMLLTEHFRQIVRTFADSEIPVLALKGVLLSEWLYGNINLRQFSDLDLLVPMEKGPLALELLDKMGYKASNLNMSDFIKEHSFMVHYPPMAKQGVSVEIHLRIHAESESYRVDLPRMWQNAVPVTLHGVSALAFCPEDLLLHLCFHLDKHFRIGKFQFTCLYDIVNMLNHKGDLLDWELFALRCREANAESVTYPYLLMAEKYMNARLPKSVSDQFASYLTPKGERALMTILRGRGETTYAFDLLRMVSHLGLLVSFRYVFDLFFPTVDFMMRRYRLKRKSQLLIYYPYRMVSAFRNLWVSLKKVFS